MQIANVVLTTLPRMGTGEITTEPLQIIVADDPVTCALYSKEKNFFDWPGWKGFKKIAKQEK
jgi:hypothetical protein